MRKIIVILLVSAVCTASALAATRTAAPTTYKADDSHITYVGRTVVAENGSVSFDWSSTMVRIAFEGNSLSMKCSDTHRNYYNLWIDAEPTYLGQQIIVTEGTDTTIVLATGLKAGKHTAVLQKRTEGEQGTTTIYSFTVCGKLLQAEPLKARQIEFVGDSYTCGYGADSRLKSDPFDPKTENASATYAAILGRLFDADIITTAHSGQGIARNYDGFGRDWHMPERYDMALDQSRDCKWNAAESGLKPAMTIIYLGTNDFSCAQQPSYGFFKSQYISLLKKIKANWGEDHPILMVSSKCDQLLFDYVRRVANECGLSNVWYNGVFPGVHYDQDGDLGASWHPSYEGHRKLAWLFVPYVSTITGWPIPEPLN